MRLQHHIRRSTRTQHHPQPGLDRLPDPEGFELGAVVHLNDGNDYICVAVHNGRRKCWTLKGSLIEGTSHGH